MTYLGQKGFTIPKSTLSVEQQVKLRKELTVKPYLPTCLGQTNPFPVYRESNNKFYIPRN